MALQRFYASPTDTFTWPNGAVGHRPGGSFDCLGPYAKIINCPIAGTIFKRTVYATDYADTFFSIPAHCKFRGKRIRGYLTQDDTGVFFVPYTGQLEL